MTNVQRKIDDFILRNLTTICKDGNLKYLTYDQLIDCISNNDLCLREIDIFSLAWQWLIENKKTDCKFSINGIVKHIRFALISAIDIVRRIESIKEMMANDVCRETILSALNYHVIPYNQPTQTKLNNGLRSPILSVISVGGREINPSPCLHDLCFINDFHLDSKNSESLQTEQQQVNRRPLTRLPCLLSHMQVVVLNNFLYVIGEQMFGFSISRQLFRPKKLRMFSFKVDARLNVRTVNPL